MKTIKIIFPFIAALVFLTAADAAAEQTIAEKIDSIFVIASSLDIKYREQVEPARQSIADLGIEAVPHLIEMLGTPHGRERAALEDIFKKIGNQAVPLLNKALLTTDSLRLSRVATILYYHPDTSSVENLLRVADDDYYSARYQVIRALGKIGDRRAVPAVRAALRDTVELVRTIAAVSAGRLKDSTLFPDLIAAFDDDYYGVRMSALEQLKSADCPEKVVFIEAVIEGVSVSARKNLLTVIAEDTCRYNLETVEPFLSDPDPLVQSLAIKAAYRLDPDYMQQYLSTYNLESESFILHQTIRDILTADEKEAPANP